MFFSFAFHPVFLPTAGLALIFGVNSYINQTTPLSKQLFLVFWIFMNTAAIPMLFTFFLRWKKMVSSIQLDSREDRIVPFAFALLFYLTNYWLLRDIPMPHVIYSMFLGSSIAVAAALFFTFFTKISIHMVGMGGVTAALYGLSQLFGLPLDWLIILAIVASGLVGTARYILQSHNLQQIYLGWITGFVCLYLPIFYGWG